MDIVTGLSDTFTQKKIAEEENIFLKCCDPRISMWILGFGPKKVGHIPDLREKSSTLEYRL